MAAPRLRQTKVRTPLAHWRLQRGMTQREMWEAAGISRGTYLAMEHGRKKNPQVRLLANCATVLGVDVGELIGPDLRAWWKRYPESSVDEPEDPSALWRENE